MAAETTLSITTDSYRWQSLPVTTYRGSIEQISAFLPHFERRTFGPELLPVPTFDDSYPFYPQGFNPFYDVIVRQPLNTSEVTVPVGIVSRQYALVQHQAVLDKALIAIRGVGIDSADVEAELDLTEYGEQMRLGLLFPEKYNMVMNGGDKFGLRLECFNSVDGSMKFTCVIGWLRFVCSNGLIVGVADTYYKQRHNRFLEMNDIAAMLKSGIAATTRERETYLAWAKKKVTEEKLAKWTNTHLAKRWGVKAAARTWHITRSGHDVSFVDPFEKGLPTEKSVRIGKEVPGAVFPGDTVYAVAQSLAWLAKERRDVQEQLQLKQQIHGLVRPLLMTKGG